MKKTLSLILAVLMCAAATPAVFADEALEVPAAPVEDTAVIEEIAADDAGIMLISELEGQIVAEVVIDAEAIIALGASFGITVPVEMAEALLAAEAVPTAESLKTGALVFGIELTDEAVAAFLAFLAPIYDVPAEMADTDVIGVAEAATEIVVAEEAAIAEEIEEVVEEVVVEEVEEVVEEEVSKYPVILEETPTFGLFGFLNKLLSIFTFRG